MSGRLRLADLGGVVVGLEGPRRWARGVAGQFGIPLPGRLPAPELRIGAGAAPPPPAHPPDLVDGDGRRMWWAGDDFWGQSGTVLVHASRSGSITLPPDDVRGDLRAFLQYALAWCIAGPGRALLHGGAVGRSGATLLVIGRSGQGKSTTALAALHHGWDLIAEDLAVVRAGDGLDVQGLARDLMVPADLLAGTGISGRPMGDRRDRAWIPRRHQTAPAVPLAGVIVSEHGDGAGHLRPVAAPDRAAALLNGLAMPAAPPVLQLHVPMMAKLAELPMWRLGHAADPADRLAEAAGRLDEAIAQVAGS